LIKLEKS